MRLFTSVCGCSDPVSDSITSLRSFASGRGNKNAEELVVFKRERCPRTPLEHKYYELEAVLNNCKEELLRLRNSSGLTPSRLRHQYVALGGDLRRCKEDLKWLQEEAVRPLDAPASRKRCRELDSRLQKYRKDMEDELQKCWTQLKLQHLESQFASTAYGLT